MMSNITSRPVVPPIGRRHFKNRRRVGTLCKLEITFGRPEDLEPANREARALGADDLHMQASWRGQSLFTWGVFVFCNLEHFVRQAFARELILSYFFIKSDTLYREHVKVRLNGAHSSVCCHFFFHFVSSWI
jgi:hypothetical protein